MLLSNEDIKRYLKKRLIQIEPEPAEEQIGPASVDLTLGDEFWIFNKNPKGKKIDIAKTNYAAVTKKVRAKFLVLEPGEIVLGKTVEKIKLPNNIAGRLEGRSTYARLGIAVHVTSSIIQPGSFNHQVLEIVNLSPNPIILRAGTRISQVLFETLASNTSKPYAKFGKIARVQ